MSNKNNSKFQVLAPLSDFNWNGNTFLIPNLGTIQRLDTVPDLSWCEKFLSNDDKYELSRATHWLSFEQLPDDRLTTEEKIYTFLLALWIGLATQTCIKFRFEFPHKLGNGQISTAVRVASRFQWIKGQVEPQIKTKHLRKICAYFDSIRSIYISGKRLRTSLVLTFNGCITRYWQAAFICFSAAAEGILTYKKGRGITKRLARSFACLTKTTKHERDSAYRAFFHSYNIRSDIMHGRTMHLNVPAKNLRELAKFSNLLRKLWKTILSSKIITTVLEKSDTDREAWFARKEKHYKIPKIYKKGA